MLRCRSGAADAAVGGAGTEASRRLGDVSRKLSEQVERALCWISGACFWAGWRGGSSFWDGDLALMLPSQGTDLGRECRAQPGAAAGRQVAREPQQHRQAAGGCIPVSGGPYQTTWGLPSQLPALAKGWLLDSTTGPFPSASGSAHTDFDLCVPPPW